MEAPAFMRGKERFSAPGGLSVPICALALVGPSIVRRLSCLVSGQQLADATDGAGGVAKLTAPILRSSPDFCWPRCRAGVDIVSMFRRVSSLPYPFVAALSWPPPSPFCHSERSEESAVCHLFFKTQVSRSGSPLCCTISRSTSCGRATTLYRECIPWSRRYELAAV